MHHTMPACRKAALKKVRLRRVERLAGYLVMLTAHISTFSFQAAAKDNIDMSGRANFRLKKSAWSCQPRRGRIQAQKNVNSATLQSGICPPCLYQR